MRNYAIELKENEGVTELKKENNIIYVKTDKGEYQAKTVIIASGKRSRELGVPGEKEFRNKGLTYCATCDGPLFGGKDVAVIGGGNSALDAILQLINIANRIYVVNITPQLSGDSIMIEKVMHNDKVIVYNSSRVTSVVGDKVVKAINIKTQTKQEALRVEGVIVEIGLIPNSEFTKDIEKNKLGEIKVNSYNETNIAGIFAAGDVTDVPEKQIIIAAGEGSKAVLSTFRYLAQQM